MHATQPLDPGAGPEDVVDTIGGAVGVDVEAGGGDGASDDVGGTSMGGVADEEPKEPVASDARES